MSTPIRLGRLSWALAALMSTAACQAEPAPISADDSRSPLHLERKIALPGVKGRIDHLAFDPVHDLLFVAEYGNGTVDAVDLAAGRVVGRITGLHEPQGIGVSADSEEIVVACGDGTVHFYAAEDRREIASLSLGDDADDVRMDSRNGHAVIGYGSGGLAVIDMAEHRVLSRLALPGHPEGFSLAGAKAFINIPDRGAIVVGDLDQGAVSDSWSTAFQRMNFPIALDHSGKRLAIGYRLPSAMQIRNADNGAVLTTVAACGDADDMFFADDRLYLVCGSGYVDLFSAKHPETGGMRAKTAPGARTGYLEPSHSTLYVVAPARTGDAAILEFRLVRPRRS